MQHRDKKKTKTTPTAVKPSPAQREAFDWRGWAVPVVGAAIGALAFLPAGVWMLAPVAPIAFFVAVRDAATAKLAFRRLLIGGWIFYFGSIQWILEIRHWAPFPLFGVLGVLLLALYMSLWIAVPMWALRKWLWPNTVGAQLFAFGAVWMLSEWLRTLGRLAMPLGQIGHTWAEFPELIQIAAWLGELGVGFQILLIAGVIVYMFQCDRTNRRSRLYSYAGLVLILALIVFNALSIADWSIRVGKTPVASKPHINLAIVQPNIPQALKIQSYPTDEDTEASFRERMKLAADFATTNSTLVMNNRKPDWQLVVMPETAYTELDFFTNETLQRRVSELARAAGVDILFGSDRNLYPLHKNEIYNTAFIARRDGTMDQVYYDKMRLVPFGEGLPYFNMIPGFQESVVGLGSLNEGAKPVLFESHGMKIGTMICFESTFSQMGRMYAKMGADMLVVMTNDAWFGVSAGPRAHFDLSLLRAVETRRWVVRAANTGISAIITPAGTIQKQLELGTTGVIEGKIPKSDAQEITFFMQWGNAWLVGGCVAVMMWCVWLRRKRVAGTASA